MGKVGFFERVPVSVPSMSVDDTTLAGVERRWDRPAGSPSDVWALTVLWCAHEPHRMGEVVVVDTFGPGTIGRGEGDGVSRLKFRRIRPGSLKEMPPLESPSLSRNQLSIGVEKDGLRILNSGRCPLLINGDVQDEALVKRGDTVEIDGEMVFLCVSRPPFLEAGPSCGEGQFGQPDAAGIVGDTPTIWDVRQRAKRVAEGDSHVIILGPSGCGKELVAQAIHAQTDSGSKEMVSRNAATIPEGLVDAELFGNIRNYPNPGIPERMGLIGAADGSTLFLDEIGELPERLQVHLLRLLDKGEFQRLGDSKVRYSRFRMIGATNRPTSSLKDDILARFRVRLVIPGLCERREDIPLLAVHLLRCMRAKNPRLEGYFDGEWPRMTPSLMRALVCHSYTTHVRELDQILWACVDRSAGDFIESVDGCGLRGEGMETHPSVSLSGQETLDKKTILDALKKHDGVRAKVWSELGLRNRHQLARLMKKYGISTDR